MDMYLKQPHGWFTKRASTQCPGIFLGIIGRDPSVSKTHQLHVDISQKTILTKVEDHSIYFSKWIDNVFEVLNLNQLFLKLN